MLIRRPKPATTTTITNSNPETSPPIVVNVPIVTDSPPTTIVAPVEQSVPVLCDTTNNFVASAVSVSSVPSKVVDYTKECFWYYERFLFTMLEEYTASLLRFANLEAFVIANTCNRKLTAGYWMFDGSIFSNTPLSYKRIIPMTVFKQLSIPERVRLAERKYTDYECIGFRLLYFIIWDDSIRRNDPFVCFQRKDEEAMIEFLVLSRSSDKVIEMVSNVLSLGYHDLKSKCQTYRNVLRCTPGVFQQEEAH